jgi:UDP-glucose 4-epimerase
MTVLTDGRTGCVESHAALVLSEHGLQVAPFDTPSNSSKSVIPKIESIIGPACSFVGGDVCNSGPLNVNYADHQQS